MRSPRRCALAGAGAVWRGLRFGGKGKEQTGEEQTGEGEEGGENRERRTRAPMRLKRSVRCYLGVQVEVRVLGEAVERAARMPPSDASATPATPATPAAPRRRATRDDEPVEHAHDVRALVVHDRAGLLVPQHRHCVLAVRVIRLLVQLSHATTQPDASDALGPHRTQSRTVGKPAAAGRTSRMVRAPLTVSGMQSVGGNWPWPVGDANGGSSGLANVHPQWVSSGSSGRVFCAALAGEGERGARCSNTCRMRSPATSGAPPTARSRPAGPSGCGPPGTGSPTGTRS